MNARGFLFACLALITGSIVCVPLSAHCGLPGGTAATLSSLSLLGGIGAAFLTVKQESDGQEQK